MTSSPHGLPIADIEARLARDPDNGELLYARAGALTQLGRYDEARADYLAVIAGAPDHFGALNDLGTLLYNTDFRSAARVAYAEAVRRHEVREEPARGQPQRHARLADLQVEVALQLRLVDARQQRLRRGQPVGRRTG